MLYATLELFRKIIDLFDPKQLETALVNKNQFDFSALDNIYNNPNQIAILDTLKKIIPNIPNIRLKTSKTMPPIISHYKLCKNFVYFMRLHYYNTDYTSFGGNCSGLTHLWHYYSALDKQEYYLKTLQLIAAWDGTEASLNQPFDKTLPQAKFYKNLSQLFHQWMNDIHWFQKNNVRAIGFEASEIKRQALVISEPEMNIHSIKKFKREWNTT